MEVVLVLKRPSAALLHVRDWEERKPKTSIGVHLSVWCILISFSTASRVTRSVFTRASISSTNTFTSTLVSIAKGCKIENDDDNWRDDKKVTELGTP